MCSVTNDIIFYYNVTDAVSAVANCSLVVNGTAIKKNLTIAEGRTLNFTYNDMPNGNYVWTLEINGSNYANGTVMLQR